jgi:predicted dehydrogenase
VIKVACLGAGYFSQFHIGSWLRIDGVSLVGICDHDVAKADAFGRPAFGCLSTMLVATTPDILDVILPPSGHKSAIQEAVAAGVRTIICQKPFCTSLQEAKEVTDLVQAAGCTLIVHENFRFQPWYRAMKSALDQGLVGGVLQATFRLRPGDGQGPHAYLERQPYFRDMPELLIHETGVHFIDVFRYLLGDPSHVYADLRRVNPVIKGEDAGFVVFDHAVGVRAVFDGNRCLDHAADNTRRTMGEAVIEGTQGTLSLGGDGAVWLRKFGQTDAQMILGPDTYDGFGGDCTHALQQHVVEAVQSGAGFENEATEYLSVIETEKAIYQSAREGRKIAL